MTITLELLKLRTSEERWQMYKNALQKPESSEAKHLIALIEDNQLSMTNRGGFPAEHSMIRAIHDVCFSPEGIEAGMRATDQGLPAMAFVDPILTERVQGYAAQLDSHTWAGTYVAEAMEGAGFRRTGRAGKLPDGCSAKTAMLFERRK